MFNPITHHQKTTKDLAASLDPLDVYKWLVVHGYFPESYVLPPCFQVTKNPSVKKKFFPHKKTSYKPPITEYAKVHFPKTELTDRIFGVIHPEIHNDIAFHISENWADIVEAIFPADSIVTSYSFPIPIDSKQPGRIGYLRSGRMIYEFISMVDDDIAAVAYQYTHISKADIKGFYPSIYTHSIAWALHTKAGIRAGNLHNYSLLGNRLDKLFQNANDSCTNGIPIGPVVSDLIAEIIASGVDRLISAQIQKEKIDCEIVRFKDDYRFLTKSEGDAKALIKILQAKLKEFNLELSDEKTTISLLPDGLFREWVSMYHAIHPVPKAKYSWKEFRELYLAVLRIDKQNPGTGVIDRFLADILDSRGRLKVGIHLQNLQKVISMLLMLGTLRVKAFPKVIGILESILRSTLGFYHKELIVNYLEAYLKKLSEDEERNKYLITWICYFLVSNNLNKFLTFKPKYKDKLVRAVFLNKGLLFSHCRDFKIFSGCRKVSKKISLLKHLDVFDPPVPE